MKKRIVRMMSVLLAVVMLFGLMPTVSLAGPSEEMIDYAGVFVGYPMAGEHPSVQPLPTDPNEACFTVEDCAYITNSGYGRRLFEDECFEAGETYRVQIHLVAANGFEFSQDTWCEINDRDASADLIRSNEAWFSVLLTAVSETVTLRFDANLPGVTPPAPVEVPLGGTLWDAVRNFDEISLPDQPYEQFYGWALDPFAEEWDYYPGSAPVTEETTLFAIWTRCVNKVELFVELPENMLIEDVNEATIHTPRDVDYEVYPANFWTRRQDIGNYDLIYCAPFEKGKTYYSSAYVYTDVAGELPEVLVYGAKKLEVRRVHNYEIQVDYSVTIPAGSSITSGSFWINTPKAGESAGQVFAEPVSLTPGLGMNGDYWYESPAVTFTEPFTGSFEPGKTYYTLVSVGSPYEINWQNLKLTPLGENVEIVEYVDLASWYAIPNYVGAVVAVTIPEYYEFIVEVPYGGGKFRYDRGDFWTTIMDFGEPEGPVTLEARPDGEHLFKMWYDAKTFQRLSKDAVYSFQLDRDVHIRAEFVERLPFEDVGAWDYFYEPVQWAIHHDPVITGGKDDTHFAPKDPCTREQIVTFLWKAVNAPEPQSAENPFSDVKPGKYYYKAVLWANEKGVTGGVGDGKFGVGKTCTREQAMVFLWKAAGAPEPQSTENPFRDVKAGKYYYKAVLWAVENGVTSGTGNGVFGVGKTCTRAQIITFLYKVFGPKG